jgi:hypothetical protein
MGSSQDKKREPMAALLMNGEENANRTAAGLGSQTKRLLVISA